jgi:hypothetical protein
VSHKNRFGFSRFFEIRVKIAANLPGFPLFPTSIKKLLPQRKTTPQLPRFPASQLPSFLKKRGIYVHFLKIGSQELDYFIILRYNF